MPATLTLLTTAPGRESAVQAQLGSVPDVSASRVLFEGHVVARVAPGVDAEALSARIDGIRSVATYS